MVADHAAGIDIDALAGGVVGLASGRFSLGQVAIPVGVGVGAGTGAAMTAAELAETVRVAYDPAAGPLLDRARAQQAPDLAAAADANPEVRFVGLNTEDGAPTAQAFERKYAVPYPSILDAGSGENVLALAGLVSPQSIPTTLVLDREGRPAARVLGRIDPEIFQGLLDDAIAEGAPQ